MSSLANGKVILKFNNSVLVENFYSSFYSNFILNLYIVSELNTWPRNPTNTFPLKHCLFVTVKLVRNTSKHKFIYNGWEIAFDGEGSWSFDNDFARNIVIFGFDNSSSCHTDNRTDGLLDGINDSTGAAEKKLVLTLVKQIQNFV